MPEYPVAEAQNTEQVQTTCTTAVSQTNITQKATKTTTTKASAAAISAVQSKNTTPTVQAIAETSQYADGTYTGTGTGFSGPITVEVTVSSGKIAAISIVSTSDDSPYISAASALLNQIIQLQSTNVDTVSGATYSSVGLIEAVRNALAQAGIVEENVTTVATTATTSSAETTTTESVLTTEAQFPYPDGVYQGIGTGYRGEICVQITLQSGRITEIQVLNSEDDQAFFQKAVSLLSVIQNRQSTAVDTISGATFSSEGILEAVQNALDEAKRAAEQADANTIPDEDTNPAIDSDAADEKEDTTTDTLPDSTEVSICYKDGTYTNLVLCKPDEKEDFSSYWLSVTVRIENGTIAEITDIQDNDSEETEENRWYIQRAVNGTTKLAGVVPQILERQSTEEIDVVSGATCSSHAILEAVQTILEDATADEEKE